MRSASVLEPVGMAIETARRVLFQPFEPVKWLAIGFTAWLSALTDYAGVGANFDQFFNGSGQSAQSWRPVLSWMQAHLLFVLLFALAFAALALVVGLLVEWVSCRGKFMFLDNVVSNRAEIALPWKQFRVQGNSLFLFTICLWLALLAALLVAGAVVLLIGWPDIARSHFGWHAALAAGLGVFFLACLTLISACVSVFLYDFVVPIMALKSCRVMEGWASFFDLFRARAGIFILYLLFKALLSIAVDILTLLICCLLCCSVLIPYVGVVILLPIHVFWRSYSVHFLGQFGDELRMFDAEAADYIALGRP